ncbi:MAG: hypothetical protein KKA36_09105 [Gammaproteobacteria bacterium]|nr:hypothetical protein [Gammaproteobacteria bacterium]MBU2479234.1 hypothetical protein [Gammaproteobacteria bacterium]
MLQLKLDDVQTGMVVGQDVLGAKGQLLLCAGATLTGKHLDVLRSHRVQQIMIKPPPATPPAPGLDPAEISAQLETKFRFCDEQQPLIHELRRLYRKRLTGNQEDTE